MSRSLLPTCVLPLLLLTGCSQTPAPAPINPEAEAKALTDGEVKAFIKDWSGKDVERIVSHYADDGSVELPNSPILTGKDAMRPALKQLMADPAESLTLTPAKVEVAKGGDLGYTQGTYVLTVTDPATRKVVTEKGKFVTIFRKQADGSWKAIQDISNADAPAAPAGR